MAGYVPTGSARLTPRKDGIEWLASLGAEFAASAQIGETLRNALQRVMERLEAEAASIFLLDETSRDLICRACAGPMDISGIRVVDGQGIVGRASATGIVQMVRDVRKDRDFAGFVDRQTGFRTRSVLCAPLRIQDRTLGVIEVINKKSSPGLFTLRDRNQLLALASMAALAIHNAHMAAALVEQERMRRELELAGEIQRGLLPEARGSSFPVHGINLPALEVSGDFFSILELADGRICFSLGDVSGKGMNAALLMAKTVALFQCLGKAGQGPGALLGAINRELAATASHGMFVTMAAGILDPGVNTLRLANAGHQPPLLRRRDGAYREIEAQEPPLGILPDLDFGETEVPLEDGSLYVFSDGLTEGWVGAGARLEVEGVKDLIEEFAGLPAPERLEHIVARLRRPDTRLHDDLTLLVVEYPAPILELRLPAQPESLKTVRDKARETAETAGFARETAEQIVLAVNEACMNVIQHGYRNAPGQEMLLQARLIGRTLAFDLLDRAPAVTLADLRPRALDEIRPGGLGIHFIRQTMDVLQFLPPPPGFGNLLRMSKRLGEAS